MLLFSYGNGKGLEMGLIEACNTSGVGDDANECLARAFKQLIENRERRDELLEYLPELKNAVAFYERGERFFNKEGGLSRHDQRVLMALKENMFFQIRESGPSSFDALA